MVGYLTEIDDAETVVFLREIIPDQIRANMRSKAVVDVARVASLFGGGGHVRAAGCNMNGTFYDVLNNLSRHIETQLIDK